MIIQTSRLPHRVTITEVAYSRGTRTEGTAQTNIRARVFQKTFVVTSPSGERLISKTLVAFRPSQVLTNRSEITIDGVARPIESIIKVRDSNNVLHHIEVLLT